MSERYTGAFGSTDDSRNVFDQQISDFDSRYHVGSHSMPTETDANDLRRDAENLRGLDDDAADLLEQAAETYESMDKDPSGWECPDCGLRHSHSMVKQGHQLTEEHGLNVRTEFAEGVLNYNQRCHCGVNELSMLLDFVEHIDMRIFRDLANDEIPGPSVVTTAERLRDAVPAEEKRKASLDDSYETRREILNDMGSELVQEAQSWQGTDGLTRVVSVRNAADSAPIHSTTKQDIESIREALDDDLDRDPVAEVIADEVASATDPEQAVENAWFRLYHKGIDTDIDEVRDRVHERFFDN